MQAQKPVPKSSGIESLTGNCTSSVSSYAPFVVSSSSLQVSPSKVASSVSSYCVIHDTLHLSSLQVSPSSGTTDGLSALSSIPINLFVSHVLRYLLLALTAVPSLAAPVIKNAPPAPVSPPCLLHPPVDHRTWRFHDLSATTVHGPGVT